MKLDTAIIPADQPAIVAEAQRRRLGKYQVRSSWNFSPTSIRSTMGGQPVLQPSAYAGPCASPFMPSDPNWGEQDDGSGIPRSKMPTAIKLAIDPTLAQEGDE